MSSPLSYLLRTRLKNLARSILRSPTKLIYAIVLIALFGFTIWAGLMGDGENTPKDFADLRLLWAGAMALLTFLFFLIANSGFQTGASLFKLPDVNFLFAGPFQSRAVLFYGLFQQLGTSLLVGAFLLFQYGWIHNVFGLGLEAIFVLLLAYGLTMFLGQFCAMLIYVLLSARPQLRRPFRILFWAVPFAWALWYLLVALGQQDQPLPAISAAAWTLPGWLLPVGGWLAAAAGGALTGAWLPLILGLGLTLSCFAVLLCLLSRLNADFYEDVLQSTETAHAVLAEQRQGLMMEKAGKRVRTGKLGLGGGWGASVFFYKHRVENRRNGFLPLNKAALLMLASSLVFAYFIRDEGLFPAFLFSVYLQVFSVTTARAVQELARPYAYLVPASPFHKLLASLISELPAFLIDALLFAVPMGLIFSLPPLLYAMLFLCRLSFSLLFLSSAIAEDRVFGGVTSSKGLTMLFYFLCLLVMAAPGVALTLFLFSHGVLPLGVYGTALGAMALCNIPMALLVLFLCRGIFANAELNNS